MAKEKINPQLEKILKLVNTNNIIGPEEIDQLLDGIVSIIETFQQKSVALNNEVEGKIRRGLEQLAKQHNTVIVEMEEGRAVAMENATEAVTRMVEQANKKIDKTIAKLKEEVAALVPEKGDPGRDADEEAIFNRLAERFKLPEYTADTGEDIIKKINETEGEENKIDASRIKNLPKAKKEMSGMVGVKSVTSSNFRITDTANFNKDISIPIQPTAPSDPFEGMLWIDNS